MNAPCYWIEIPQDVLMRLGQIVVQWAHLDATISSHVRILLGVPEANQISKYPDHLKISGKERLALYRELGVLFSPANAEHLNRTLDKVANVRQHRERLIHGNITPQEETGRLLVHYAEEHRDGRIRGGNYWYTAHRLQVIAEQMAEADYALGDVFRAYWTHKHA